MSSCQHLFRHIAKDHEVFWINTIGMRRPRLSSTDLRKAQRKLFRMLKSYRSVSSAQTRLSVSQPAMLPYSNFSWVRKVNARSVSRTVRKATAQTTGEPPIIVTTVPNSADYLARIENQLVVYYCVDDMVEWPGIDSDLVREMEQRLIEQADVLVATSTLLYERLKSTGKPTHLLTHGVDVDLFSRPAQHEHATMSTVPKPRVGYFGLFDDRSDQELLAAVAVRMKDFSFVISGPVETSVEILEKLPNVFFTGPIAYLELPALIEGLSALFIPYRISEFTNAISPLKLKEYLVTGKPVVSTPIAEAKQMQEYVSLAATPTEWERELRAAQIVDVASRRKLLCHAFTNESWAMKANALLKICSYEK
jgi:glycosyltransferase involved in cell wall biosynthesis